MGQLTGRTFDADSHYYETTDCFERHMPADRKHRAFHLEVIDGVERPVVDGRPVNVFQPGGFFKDEAGLPGSLREMMRAMKSGAASGQGGHGGSSMSEPIHPAALDRGARLATMDEQGIEATLMFPSTGVFVEPTFLGDADLLWDNFRALNRWIDEEWGLAADGRIVATPMISLIDRDAACDELDWALSRHARAVCLTAGPAAGRSPADPWFDPFWARMNEAGVVCCFHVADSAYNARLSPAWGEQTDPMGYEQSAFQWTHQFGDRPIMETVSALIYGNLFGRYPDVRVATVEFGSLWVDYLLKAMDKMVGMARGGPWPGGRLEDKPSEIFRRHVWVSPFHEEDVVGLAELIGADRVLFGSDWPHPEGLANPNDFADLLTTMSDGDTELIMRGNLESLLSAA